MEQGTNIYAYDLVGSENFAEAYPEGPNGTGSIMYVTSIDHALEVANVCFIFTEWKEIKVVTPEAYSKLMRNPLVYDGKNIYNVGDMEEAEVEYHSIIRRPSSREGIKESKNFELQNS